MNQQKPIKQILKSFGSDLIVNEIFYTIQGEGPFSGRPAVFIRLGGCNLQCTWCDTEYTEGNTTLHEGFILESVDKLCPISLNDILVVITGGEPFRQNITSLCCCLLEMGCTIQVETNGTLSNPDFPWDDVHVVVSPKTSFIHEDFLTNNCYFKYVISEEDVQSVDGLPVFSTQPLGKKPPASPNANLPINRVYLSPLDSHDSNQNFRNRKVAVDHCMKFGYNLSLQTHKLLNLP